MAAISYTVNGQHFGTQRELEQYTQAILRHYRPPTRLTGDDGAFMADLLERHPSAERKIGCGVQAIWIRSNGKFGVGFYVERTDGTFEDFSYKQCLRPFTHASKCKFAFRRAIDAQVNTVKRRAFTRDGMVLPCPITGQPMTWETAHVDHEPPRTFAALLEQFMTEIGISYDDIALEESPGGIGKALPADLARVWAAWHACEAVLRVISAEANLRLVR
jgi:hypothetical protein